MLRNNIILKPHLVSTPAFLIWLTKKLDLIMRTRQKNAYHVKPIFEAPNVT